MSLLVPVRSVFEVNAKLVASRTSGIGASRLDLDECNMRPGLVSRLVAALAPFKFMRNTGFK